MPKKKIAAQPLDLDKALVQALSQMEQVQANIAKIQAAKQQQLDQRRAALRAQINEHAQAVKALQEELKNLDTVDVSKPTVAAPKATAAKKPGPKPGLKKAAPVAKTAPKATPKVAAKKAAPKKAAAKAVAKKPAAKTAAKTTKPAAKAAAKKAAPKKAAAKKGAAKKAAAKPSKAVSSAVAEGRRAVARGDRPPMKEAIARVMGKSTMDAAQVIAGLTAKNWLPNTPPEKTQQYISYVLSSTKEVFDRVERGQYKVKEGVTFVHKTKAPKAKAAAAPKKETPAKAKDDGIDIDALVNPFETVKPATTTA